MNSVYFLQVHFYCTVRDFFLTRLLRQTRVLSELVSGRKIRQIINRLTEESVENEGKFLPAKIGHWHISATKSIISPIISSLHAENGLFRAALINPANYQVSVLTPGQYETRAFAFCARRVNRENVARNPWNTLAFLFSPAYIVSL